MKKKSKIPFATAVEEHEEEEEEEELQQRPKESTRKKLARAAEEETPRKRSARAAIIEESNTPEPIVSKLLKTTKAAKDRAFETKKLMEENAEKISAECDDAQDMMFQCLPNGVYPKYTKAKEDVLNQASGSKIVFYENTKWFHWKETCVCLNKDHNQMSLHDARQKKMKCCWKCTLI